MTPGITFQADESVMDGHFNLVRDGSVAVLAMPMDELGKHYRPGDIVVVSERTYDEITAMFARDVTPRGRQASDV